MESTESFCYPTHFPINLPEVPYILLQGIWFQNDLVFSPFSHQLLSSPRRPPEGVLSPFPWGSISALEATGKAELL